MTPRRSPLRPPHLWSCPKCRRRFSKKNQWHSCHALNPAYHFKGKNPQLRKTYERLLKRLKSIGPVRVDAVKRSINFASRFHFGGVMVRQNHMVLGFVANRTIRHRRIHRSQPLGLTKVGHSVRLSTPDDVDDQLLEWLRQAYRIQAE